MQNDVKQELCKDTINREVVLDFIRDNYRRWFVNDAAFMQCMSGIKDIVSVQPSRKGHWIELPKALNPNENPCKCSECGHILSFMNYYPKSNFCPNCGACMKDGRTLDEFIEDMRESEVSE